MSEGDFDALINALYDAAYEQAKWSDALGALARYAESLSAQLFLWDGRSQTTCIAAIGASGPADGESDPAEEDELHDPRLLSTVVASEGPVAAAAGDIVPHAGRFFAATCLYAESGQAALVGLHRTVDQGQFKHSDLMRLERVVPHLSRALKMSSRLAMLSTQQAMLQGTLNNTNGGLAVVDGTGLVMFMNKMAERIFQQRDGLRLVGGRIAAESSEETRALHLKIAQTIESGKRASEAVHGFQSITRGSLKRPFAVMVGPLGGDYRGLVLSDVRDAALILIGDPETRAVPHAASLCAMFGLTDAEARIAVALAAGKTLDEIAHDSGRSKNTLRAQMQVVFEKTGTSRQAELVRLLLSMPHHDSA